MNYNILSRHTDKFKHVRDNIKYFHHYEMALDVNQEYLDFDYFKAVVLENMYNYEKKLNEDDSEDGSDDKLNEDDSEDGSDDKISCYDSNSIKNLSFDAYIHRVCEYYDTPIIYGTQVMYLSLKYNRQTEYVKVDFGKIPSVFELLYISHELLMEKSKDSTGSYNGRFYFITGNYKNEYINVFKPDVT